MENPFIEIVYPSGDAMQTEFLEKGGVIRIKDATLGFGVDAQVRFSNSADTLKMFSNDTISIDRYGRE